MSDFLLIFFFFSFLFSPTFTSVVLKFLKILPKFLLGDKFTIMNEHSKVFSGDPEVLRSERRKKIMPVESFEKEVLLKLKFRDSAVDYGAGIGYFTIPLSKHFKKVYAVELNREMIEKLQKELENEGIKNVEIIESNKPPDLKNIDFVLFSNVLHEVDDYNIFLDWAKNFKITCVIDWEKVETEFGPPLEHRIPKDEMKKAMEKHFKFVKEVNIYPFHYVFIGYNDESFL